MYMLSEYLTYKPLKMMVIYRSGAFAVLKV